MKPSQPGTALAVPAIINSSSVAEIGVRRSLRHQVVFDGGAGACSIVLGVSCRMGFKEEEISRSREIVFLDAAHDFWAAQKRNATNAFAATTTALPPGSSLVTSCKISESSAPQRTRIKTQAIMCRDFVARCPRGDQCKTKRPPEGGGVSVTWQGCGTSGKSRGASGEWRIGPFAVLLLVTPDSLVHRRCGQREQRGRLDQH